MCPRVKTHIYCIIQTETLLEEKGVTLNNHAGAIGVNQDCPEQTRWHALPTQVNEEGERFADGMPSDPTILMTILREASRQLDPLLCLQTFPVAGRPTDVYELQGISTRVLKVMDSTNTA